MKMKFFVRCCMAVATMAATLLNADCHAADWPTFRGTDRTGVAPDTGLLKSWPAEGPKLVWKKAGAGRGYASLTVVGDRIYTLGDGPSTGDSKDEFLICFERATGNPLWKTKTGAPWNSGQPNWQGSRSTPTVHEDRVYVVTPPGELICCNAKSGDEIWRKNFKSDFKGTKADGWGYSESPLVDDDLVIGTPGGEQTTIVALNKKTGDVVWKTVRPGDRGAGHASASVCTIGGTKVYVQLTASGPIGVRASDGELLWSYEIRSTTAAIPSPIVRGDLVYYAVGYGTGGGGLLRQIPGEGGKVTVQEIYPQKSDLKNKHGGVVIVGDSVFFDEDSNGLPRCSDLMTGEVKWRGRGSGKGSAAIVSADGFLYVHFDDGTLALVKADPAGYVESGSFKVPGSGVRPSWAHPAIVDGLLYLRENDTILCYDLHAK